MYVKNLVIFSSGDSDYLVNDLILFVISPLCYTFNFLCLTFLKRAMVHNFNSGYFEDCTFLLTALFSANTALF